MQDNKSYLWAAIEGAPASRKTPAPVVAAAPEATPVSGVRLLSPEFIALRKLGQLERKFPKLAPAIYRAHRAPGPHQLDIVAAVQRTFAVLEVPFAFVVE